jgi:hypothetical protein
MDHLADQFGALLANLSRHEINTYYLLPSYVIGIELAIEVIIEFLILLIFEGNIRCQ